MIGAVYRQLMEIESRLLPCGLHTIGKPPTAEEAIATLVNIAALERDDDGLRSLPALLAESKGRTITDVYAGNDNGVLADVELNRVITETSRAAVGAMVQAVTGTRWSRHPAPQLRLVLQSARAIRLQAAQPLAERLPQRRFPGCGSSRARQTVRLPAVLPRAGVR